MSRFLVRKGIDIPGTGDDEAIVRVARCADGASFGGALKLRFPTQRIKLLLVAEAAKFRVATTSPAWMRSRPAMLW